MTAPLIPDALHSSHSSDARDATDRVGRLVRAAQSRVLVLLPSLLIIVFALHFGRGRDFFDFHLTYTPSRPSDVVAGLLSRAGRTSILHDPHMIAYLVLPLFPLCASALYALGRRVRPWVSLVGFALTLTGTIYMGGVFGMWTAFYGGIATMDPSARDAATLTLTALTAPHGAFLITTSLAKLTMAGLAVQALALVGARDLPKWSPLAVATGASLFVAFWDLDNWMLIGAVLILVGFRPMRSQLAGITQDTPCRPFQTEVPTQLSP